MDQRWLVLMVKEPRVGRVKTRLGRDIGMVTAAWWFRHQTARMIRGLRDPRWKLVLAVSPDRVGMASRVWPADIPKVAQGGGDLGDRMARVFARMPRGPVIIIGGDIPGVMRAHIWRGFRALGSNQAVIGPATDGGYWLIGFKRLVFTGVAVFEGVRWSTPNACADTLKNLDGMRVGFVDTLNDVDTAHDLKRHSP